MKRASSLWRTSTTKSRVETHSPDPKLEAHPNALLGIILLGAALRIGAIGTKSIWLDEAFSIWMASHPLPELFGWLVRIDQHPPLYYVLLHGWITLFGEGETAVRLLSALCSTLALPFFYGAIQRLFDERVALWATLLLALSPLQVHYAQEARMYALLTLEVAILLFFLVRILVPRASGITAKDTTINAGSGWGSWAGLSVAQAAIMLTHNTALVYMPVALQVAVLGPLLLRPRELRHGPESVELCLPGVRQPHFPRNWLLAQVAALLAWLPWARAFVVQAAGVDHSFWMEPPSFGTVIALLQALQLAHLPPSFPIFTVWHGIYWGVAVAGLVALRRKPARLWLLLSLLIVPVSISLLVSLRRPIFSIHTLLWLALPHLTLVALGLRSLAQRWPRFGKVPTAAALVALVVLLQGGALHGYYAYFHKEAWDAAAQAVATQAQPGDLILFNATWVQLPFEYYFQRYGVEAELRGVPVDLFDRGVLEPVMTEADLARLRGLLTAQRAGRNVWLIYSHNWYTDPQGLVLTELTRHLGMGEEQAFTGIRVIRFE